VIAQLQPRSRGSSKDLRQWIKHAGEKSPMLGGAIFLASAARYMDAGRARVAVRKLLGDQINLLPSKGWRASGSALGISADGAPGWRRRFKLVAGGRCELYSAYPIQVAAVLASLKAT